MPDYTNQLINTSGYRTAQTYYGKLKEQFLQQYEDYAISVSMTRASTWADQIESQFSNAVEQSGPNKGKTAFNILDEIYQKFTSNPDVVALRNEFISRFKQEYDASQIKESQFRAQHREQIRNALTREQSESLVKALEQAINSTANMSSVTLSELVKSANTFFTISYTNALQEITTQILYGPIASTRQGYIREQMEYNALRKKTINTPVKVTHGGSVKVAGKETVFDNILSFIEFSDDLFSGQIQEMKNIDVSGDINSFIIPQFQFFGEQVKSFNLRADSSKSSMHRITGSAELRDKLLSQVANKNYITLKQNLSFMAQANNIIQALGPATILYSTSAGRQWTDSFIKEFHEEQGYYLGFEYADKTVAKSNIAITENIVLMSPYTKKSLRRTSKAFKDVIYD